MPSFLQVKSTAWLDLTTITTTLFFISLPVLTWMRVLVMNWNSQNQRKIQYLYLNNRLHLRLYLTEKIIRKIFWCFCTMKSTKNCGFFEHAVSYCHQVKHEKFEWIQLLEIWNALCIGKSEMNCTDFEG